MVKMDKMDSAKKGPSLSERKKIKATQRHDKNQKPSNRQTVKGKNRLGIRELGNGEWDVIRQMEG